MRFDVEYRGGKRFEADIRGLCISFDNQEKYGGENTAPEPPETFSAAVAACIGMYAIGMLERNKISTDGFRIEVIYETAQNPNRIDLMNFAIHLPEALPAKRRKQFITTVKKCPLTGTLETLPHLNVEVIEPDSGEKS